MHIIQVGYTGVPGVLHAYLCLSGEPDDVELSLCGVFDVHLEVMIEGIFIVRLLLFSSSLYQSNTERSLTPSHNIHSWERTKNFVFELGSSSLTITVPFLEMQCNVIIAQSKAGSTTRNKIKKNNKKMKNC